MDASTSAQASLLCSHPVLPLILARDARVVHRKDPWAYFVDGKQMSKSVTRLVEHSFPKFNSKQVAEGMISGRYFYTDEAKYGKYWSLIEGKDEVGAIKAITNSWAANAAEKSELGKIMHGQIEQFYLHETPLPETKECVLFWQFHINALAAGYVPFRSEQIVFSKHFDIAGCADMLYLSPNQPSLSMPPRIWLVDWKRSEEIKKTGYGKGLGLLSDKVHCKFEHYCLQLNIYKFLLERKYNMEVERMTIVALHPNQDIPLEYEVEDNQEVVAQLLEQNRPKSAPKSAPVPSRIHPARTNLGAKSRGRGKPGPRVEAKGRDKPVIESEAGVDH